MALNGALPIIRGMKKLLRIALVSLVLLLATAALPAWAQYGAPSLAVPGERVEAALLQSQGGPVGRALAPVVGRRPIFIVYWRPGDVLSEQALRQAVEAASIMAPDAAFAPVAFTAAGQKAGVVQERLAQLGIQGVQPYEDGGGALARVFGVRALPSFVLVDAGGVLRLVGGAGLSQAAEGGLTIGEALARAGKGQPVPTLGKLPTNPIYRLLGAQLPEVNVTDLGEGKLARLSDYLEPGKKTVIFYWLPTCAHCKTELPRLRRFVEQTRPKDVKVVDLVQAPTAELVRQARGIISDFPWPHLADTDKSAGRALLVRETPTVFVVDEKGEILAIRVGAGVDWERWLGS